MNNKLIGKVATLGNIIDSVGKVIKKQLDILENSEDLYIVLENENVYPQKEDRDKLKLLTLLTLVKELHSWQNYLEETKNFITELIEAAKGEEKDDCGKKERLR